MSHLFLGSPRTPNLLFDFKAKLPKTDLTPLRGSGSSGFETGARKIGDFETGHSGFEIG